MRSQSRQSRDGRSRGKSPPRGSNQNRGQQDPPCNRVYVTFLPEDVQENTLKQMFQQCGTISKIFLKKKDDGFTFAYITYQSIDEARNAIEKLNRRKIGQKSIKVQFAREMTRGQSRDRGDSRQNGRFERSDRGGRGGGRGGFRGQGEFRKQSDTRRRFQGQGSQRGSQRGGGRGRGGRGGGRDGGDRGGFREDFGRGGGGKGEMKCFKCQGVGHISKNCTGGGEIKPFKSKNPDKMSQDQFSDY